MAELVQKIIDPQKIVTDAVLLNQLDKLGIDKDYVEFYQDYALPTIIDGKPEKEKSPYAKFYRDLKSGKKFAVISRLPRVNALGVMCEAGWLFDGKKYTSKPNQFNAEVTGSQVTIRVFNDQPTGIKSGASLTYTPTVYKGTKKVGLPSLIDDPLNENYLQNTLEWDYGICKRRLRLIEGQIQGSWVFETNPLADVKFVYNQSGDFRLKLGQYAIDSDTEIVTKAVFDSAEYPFTVSDTYTAYPDANPESTTVDGHVGHQLADQAWATIRDGAGTAFADAVAGVYIQISAGASTNTWTLMYRGIILFDVTSVPDDATDISAIESLRYNSKSDTFTTDINIGVNIYSSAPASNTALAAGDFDSLGTTPYSTTILYAAWAAGYQDFTLNATGLTALNAAIAGDGIFKTGIRDPVYDVANSPPDWEASKYASISVRAADYGVGSEPKLVVTYTPAAAEYTETATVLVGVKPIASMGLGFLGSVLIGVKPIATRTLSYTNLASVLVGIKPIASRLISYLHTASVLIGIKATAIASWINEWVETALVLIGIKPTATRLMSYINTATVQIGVKPIATLKLGFTALVQVGIKPIASRVLSYTNLASVLVGIKPIASRVISLIRTAIVQIGIKAIANLGLGFTALVKVGIVASASEVFTVFKRFIELTLNLYSRAITLNLYARSAILNLYGRTATLSLYGRSIIANLAKRAISIVMRTKK